MENNGSQPKKEPRPAPKAALASAWRMLKWGREASPLAFPVLLVLMVLASLTPFAVTYLDSRVIDEVVRLLGLDPANRKLDTLIPVVLAVLAVSLAERTLWIVYTYLDQVMHFDVARHALLNFLKKASELDMVHYENEQSHNLIQKVKDSYAWRPISFLSRSVYMSGDIVRIVSSMAIILTFSAPAFLLVLLTTIPSLIASLKLGEGSWGIWEANAADRRRFWRSADLLSRENSLMELRIFRSKDYLYETVQTIYDNFTNKEKKNQLRRSVLESLAGNLGTIGTLAFWGMAIIATLNGQITVGLLTFYTSSLNRFSESLNSLFRNFSHHYEDLLYLIDFFKFLELKNTVISGEHPVTASVNGAKQSAPPLIEFRNVDMAYPGSERLVLKNFNLTIQPGEHIALVGANGAGKTTLIKLLCRFYDVSAGQILINGVDLRELNMGDWYRHIGVLFQDFIRYGQFALRTNVELGDIIRAGDLSLLESALFKADAQRFVEQFPHRFDQLLDKSFEGGINPSDGQWQRIALGRAFFRDAPILVLDEPTSAIDAKAEYEIFERLYEFSQNKTLIIISHRFSTVRNAHKIYVIDEGCIVESGTHEELLALGGRYKDAFDTQAKGYK